MLPTDFPHIRKLIIALWPRCESDWTSETWSVLAEQVKRLDVEQATAIIREVRATQAKGWAPDIAAITKRARAALSALPDDRVVRFDRNAKRDDGPAPMAHFANVTEGAEWHLRNKDKWVHQYDEDTAAMLCKKFGEMLGRGAA